MIRLMNGMYTGQPSPVELDMNRCSHNCSYCFANLNNPKRKVDIAPIYNQIKKAFNNNDLVSYYLRNGYPLTISNHVDPFSKANYKLSIPLIKYMNELGIRVKLLTKGGYGIDEIAPNIEKSVFYISITSDSDEISKYQEPNAPVFSERIALIDYLINLGHRVYIGFNPFIPDWFNDIYSLTERLISKGIKIFLNPLHLSHSQKKELTPNDYIKLQKYIEKGSEYENSANDLAYELSDKYSDTFFYNGVTKRINLDDIYSVYPKRLYTTVDFYKYLYDTKKDLDLVYYEEYEKIMLTNIPTHIKPKGLESTLATNPLLFRDFAYKIPKLITYNKVLQLKWNLPDIIRHPFQYNFLSYLVDENNHYVEDKNGNIIGIFHKNGKEEISYTESELNEVKNENR